MVEIHNSACLTDLFGHWPGFHDAEVRALRLEAPREGQASLEADIEVAETSGDTDERGYYRDRQRVLATLRFEHILEVTVLDFRFQNVLDALEIRECTEAERDPPGPAWAARRYHVAFVPIPGFCEVLFLCDTVAVIRATPILRAT